MRLAQHYAVVILATWCTSVLGDFWPGASTSRRDGGWCGRHACSELSDKLTRMRVSAKSDYALRALIEMAGSTGVGPISAEELGRRQDIPHGFLQAILADLRKSGIVVSQRGQSGGWRLAREAKDVSVADVIRAVDGPLVSVYGLRPEAVSYNETADVLQHVWIAARHSLRDVFEQVSIADLQSRELPDAVTSRTADEDAWQPH